jgi:hypothetical protein
MSQHGTIRFKKNNVGTAVFILFRSGFHEGMKIMQNNSTFEHLQYYLNLQSKIFSYLHNLLYVQVNSY